MNARMSLLVPALMAFSIGGAAAQHEATPGETLSPAGVGIETEDAAEAPRLDPALRQMRLAALEEMTVYGAEGEEVGEVDAVMYGEDDRLLAAVSVQGWLGIEQGVVAIPVDLMAMTEDGLVLPTLTEEQVEEIMQREALDYAEIDGYDTLGEAWDARIVD